jgi:hypothetical protein
MGNVKDVEEKMPGITFELKKAGLTVNARRELIGQAQLTAHGVNKEKWAKIVSTLNGLKLFYSDTIKDDMLDALGDELNETDDELQKTKSELETAKRGIEKMAELAQELADDKREMAERLEYLEGLLSGITEVLGETEEQDVPSEGDAETS